MQELWRAEPESFHHPQVCKTYIFWEMYLPQHRASLYHLSQPPPSTQLILKLVSLSSIRNDVSNFKILWQNVASNFVQLPYFWRVASTSCLDLELTKYGQDMNS